MKDEIKEILDKLKDKNNYISHSMILLSDKETKQLLNYITTLQEEKEELKEKLENKLTAEELVNLLNQELIRQRNDYKTKINKAIEYIQDNSAFMNDDEWEVFNKKDLFNILQGDDKE